MAGFIAKLIMKHGGYGFNNYHLLALVMDIDPKAELEKEKLKEEKLKLENENKIQEETPNIPIKAIKNQRHAMKRPAYLQENEERKKPIKFGEPFLTRDEQVELLKKMRKNNVTKKPYSNMGITPMHCVCINPNSLALEHFIDIGEDLYIYDSELRKPVHYAACSPTSDNLRILHSKGVDIRDTDKVRKTPLMFACQYGRLENVKYIIENTETNIDQKSRLARGPIHFAAEYGHLGKPKEIINYQMF
jgi:ankyrin repeat protein